MKIAMSKTREQFPLSEKKIIKKTLKVNLVLAVILLVIWIIAAVSTGLSGGASVGVLGLVTVATLVFLFLFFSVTYFYQKWYWSVYFYDLTDDFIIIKKHPITPTEITIPYERVQDIYVDQDLLDRFFGLYDVHLSSATISSGMEAHIDGVEKQAADGLRKALLETVQRRISKNRNQNLDSKPAN
jgi:membrane protein YdbS with pleckstrin-like domain